MFNIEFQALPFEIGTKAIRFSEAPKETKFNKKITFFHLKEQCSETFCFWFFHESVSPQPQIIPLRSFRIFSKIRRDICHLPDYSIKIVSNFVENSQRFFYLPPVSVNLELRISPQIFEKIRNGPNQGLGGN
jgi:hypothetical protein